MNTAIARFEGGKMRHTVTLGAHRVQTDVTVEEGGDGSAPSPHDYLSAALAACTALTLRLYARRKGWPLDGAQVTVRREKREDATALQVELELGGGLTAEQRERLVQVANACPVHKTLAGKLEVQAVLKP